MRILDQNNMEMVSPDLTLGYLVPDKLFVKHHEAVAPVEAVVERKITKYPNGGMDIDPIVISPAIPGKDAWDEYEYIQRYVLYTAEELAEIEAERNKPTLESRVDVLETTTDDMILMMAELIGGN